MYHVSFLEAARSCVKTNLAQRKTLSKSYDYLQTLGKYYSYIKAVLNRPSDNFTLFRPVHFRNFHNETVVIYVFRYERFSEVQKRRVGNFRMQTLLEVKDTLQELADVWIKVLLLRQFDRKTKEHKKKLSNLNVIRA